MSGVKNKGHTDHEEEDEQDDKEEKNKVPVPTVSDALEAIRVVSMFYEARGGSSEILTGVMNIERNLERVYWTSRRQQCKMTDYSTPK